MTKSQKNTFKALTEHKKAQWIYAQIHQ